MSEFVEGVSELASKSEQLLDEVQKESRDWEEKIYSKTKIPHDADSDLSKTFSSLSVKYTYLDVQKVAYLKRMGQIEEDSKNGLLDAESFKDYKDDLESNLESLFQSLNDLKVSETGGIIRERKKMLSELKLAEKEFRELKLKARKATRSYRIKAGNFTAQSEALAATLSNITGKLPDAVLSSASANIDLIRRNMVAVVDEASHIESLKSGLRSSIESGELAIEELEQFRDRVDETLSDTSIMQTSLDDLEAPVDPKKIVKVPASLTPNEAKVSYPPRIRFFELCPPPTVTIPEKTSHRRVVDEVTRAFSRFEWRPPAGTLQPACKAPGNRVALSHWQRFMLHYVHPFQTDVTGMLVNASAGAGKSWVIALLGSTHSRAGYRISVATDGNLRTELLSAMFKKRIDLNVNNYVHGLGLRDWPQVSLGDEDSDPEEDSGYEEVPAVPDKGRNNKKKAAKKSASSASGKEKKLTPYDKKCLAKLKEMGVHWMKQDSTEVMSYVQLNNFLIGANATWTPFKDFKSTTYHPGTVKKMNEAGAPKDNCFSKWLLQIDEAHKLCTGEGTVKISGTENFLVIRDSLWYTRSITKKEDWPRVILYTATPVSHFAADAVNLMSLLVDQSVAWTDFWYKTDEHTGNREHIRSFKEANQQFLDMYVSDDGSLTPDGLKKWYALCKGKISSISMYGDRSTFAQPVFGGDGSPTGSNVTLSNNGTYEIHTTKKQSKKFACRHGVIEGCNATDKKKSQDRQDGPDIEQMANMLKENDRKQKEFLRDQRLLALGRRDDGARSIPRARKILAYVASDKTKTVEDHLEKRRFKCVNPLVKGAMKFSLPSKQYVGYMRLAGLKSKGNFRSDDQDLMNRYGRLAWKEALLAIFNSEENKDGRLILIAVLSNEYREGVSLKQVGEIYIFGSEKYHGDLVQSIARGVRYCSSTHLPWQPNVGWKVNVYLMRLMWNREFANEHGLNLNKTMEEAVRASNPTSAKSYRALEYMVDLVNKSGVDAKLFSGINRMTVQVPKM